MASPTRSRPLALALAALGIALVGAACGPNPSPSVTAPRASGSAACPTAATPPDDLPGWGPPAQAPEIVPILIPGQSQLVCGPNRFMFALVDPSGRSIGAPDRSLKVAIYDLAADPGKAISTVDGSFVWAIEGERGIYVINVLFPEAGRYGAELTTAASDGTPVSIRLTFDVQPASAVVKVGDRAPASRTPTLADVGGDASHISTDATPEPAFYQSSVDQAIADHKPFVVIFATPKFCLSAQCGPTLDRIKPYVGRYPGVTFINVEPYKLKLVDGALQADLDANDQLQTAPVTEEWHLVNEPVVFVVDRDGIVRSAFDLIFSDAELTAALDAVR